MFDTKCLNWSIENRTNQTAPSTFAQMVSEKIREKEKKNAKATEIRIVKQTSNLWCLSFVLFHLKISTAATQRANIVSRKIIFGGLYSM